jgi:hypothetical protein
MCLPVVQMHFEKADALLRTVDELFRVRDQDVSTKRHGATPCGTSRFLSSRPQGGIERGANKITSRHALLQICESPRLSAFFAFCGLE